MSRANDFFDDLETRDSEQRERDLMAALPGQIAHAMASAPYFAKLFDGLDSASINSREALAALPVTRKSDLIEHQKAAPPFGGLTAGSISAVARIFQSPGPIYEPQGRGEDFFRIARALFAAGFREGDLVHNTFAYHLTPGGFMMDSGARALGCPVIPAGPGNTEQQLDVIADLSPVAYSGTPSFLKILLDKADAAGRDASCFSKALVSGEYFPPALRQQWKERGLQALQCYVTADIGLIAYESPDPEGMIVDEGILLEIVRPGTGDPVAEGEVGEVVVTTFNVDYPLIRFATGDLSAILPGQSGCGRTNMRIKGWMGRADQTTKVKGMFVHPSQVAEVLRRHPGVGRGRLVLERVELRDTMTLHCESAEQGGDLATAIAATLRDVCKLGGAVELVAPGSLANDGVVIDDQRSYE